MPELAVPVSDGQQCGLHLLNSELLFHAAAKKTEA